MARFYVGQRVRIVALDYMGGLHDFLLGKSGKITGPSPSLRHDWRVCVDGVGDVGLGGFPLAFRSDQLEPILDTRHEACDDEFKRSLDELLERQGVGA